MKLSFKRQKKETDHRGEHVKMAVLMVNGTSNYKGRLWVRLAVGNLLRHTSHYTGYKIFLWNHDRKNPDVIQYLDSVKEHVEVLDEGNFDSNGWDGFRYDVSPRRTKNYFAGGLHVHRGPLQILYEHVTRNYNTDTVFTFDSDSWPIRSNWDVPLIYRLDRDIRLTGIWRDEVKVVTPPYVHPSCLGIKTETVDQLGLRFDYDPVPVKEDTLSHFTQTVRETFGGGAVLPLKRSNVKEYHSVFNGIYGGKVYHHHLGSRYREGKIAKPITAGWKERGEDLADNRFLLDATTAMVFEHTDDFIHDLAYGERAFDFKLYANYLGSCGICPDEAYLRLFEKAKETAVRNLPEAYYISGLVCKHFAYNTEFLEFYTGICRKMGYTDEAESYDSIMRQI